MDLLLLVAWGAVLRGYDLVIHFFGGEPTDFDWQASKKVLAVSTLITLCIFILSDIYTLCEVEYQATIGRRRAPAKVSHREPSND
jgi:uncharacterized membrane protein